MVIMSNLICFIVIEFQKEYALYKCDVKFRVLSDAISY